MGWTASPQRVMAHAVLITLVAGALVVLAGAPPARAATFFPNTTAELVAAVDDANTNGEDDVIDLGGQTFVLSSSLQVREDSEDPGKSLTIQNGTLHGDGATRVLAVFDNGHLTLDGVTVTGGSAIQGAAILNFGGGIVTITSSTISGNMATGGGTGIRAQGGGIFNSSGGIVTITSSTISGNMATGLGTGIRAQGGGIFNGGTVTITSSTISGNTTSSGDSDAQGGGIFTLGTTTVAASIIAGNTAADGGADCWQGSSAGFNVVGVDGGCPTTGTDIEADPLLGLLADNGGPTRTHAIDETSPAFERVDDAVVCAVDDQRGFPRGGSPCDAGAYEVAPLITIPNRNDDKPTGRCDVVSCTLREAVAAANTLPADDLIPLGGQTYELSFGQLLVDGLGTLTVQGPGTIDADGTSRVLQVASGNTVTLDEVTVTGGSNPDGGGILNSGTLTLTSSTVSGNTADFGGGIHNGGALTLTSSTVSGNTAVFGGGIHNDGTLTLTSSTVSGNTAEFGGGIGNINSATMKASILAGNTAFTVAPDCHGTITSQGFNVLGNADGCAGITQDGDAVADPVLGPLADNGGPTRTHAIDETSPALDRHPGTDPDCSGADSDQRGFPRPSPSGGHCDSGAFELTRALECGDTVVGMAVLTGDIGPCPGTALFVGAPDTTIIGDGHRISGQGAGAGIRTAPGVDGAGVVVRDLVVEGFATGIRLTGTGTIRVAEVQAVDNAKQGIVVRAEVAVVRDSVARRNGAAGIRAVGDQRATVREATARGNDGRGIVALGDVAVVRDALARGNVAAGIRADAGSRVTVRDSTASRNQRGIAVVSAPAVITANLVGANQGLGIAAPDRAGVRGSNTCRNNNGGGRQSRPDRLC